MSRTTKKTDFIKIDDFRNTTYLTLQDLINAYNKLIKLENLDEQLGCPLDVLGKALIQNCFYDGSDYKETNIGLINQDGDLGIVISVKEWEYGNTMYLKDYKKTWWLKKDKSE